jgi:hypothetical protein
MCPVPWKVLYSLVLLCIERGPPFYAVPLYITLHAPHTHRTIEDTFTDTHSTARDRSLATLACMPTDSILCYPCLFKFIIISHTVVSAQSASCLCHQSLS